MVMEIISIVLGMVLMCCLGETGGTSLVGFLDLPSLVLILVLTLPVLFRNGLGKDFLRAFKLLKKSYHCRLGELRRTLDAVEMMQKQIIWAALIIMVVSFIQVLAHINALQLIGPNVAVVCLSILYVSMMELLLLPLQFEVKRRIIDYMEEEQE